MIAIAQALSSELQSVHDTSVVIKAVSNQARYLALQVSILVNQAGESQLSGVSRVASDISLLSGQTFAAGQRMDTMAGQLQNRIQELSQLAQQEAAVAQSLMHRLERTQAAIAELDELLRGHEQAKPDLVGDKRHHSQELSLLMERLTQARSALSELEAVFEPALGRVS